MPDPGLVAFAAAVRSVLDMHTAALHAVQQQFQQQQHQPPGGSWAALAHVAGLDAAASCQRQRPCSLLQLSARVEGMCLQLQQICAVCRCAPVDGSSPAAAMQAAPWPLELQPYVEKWGWGPSAWQVQGFPWGAGLLEGVYQGGRCGPPVLSARAMGSAAR